MFKTERPNNGLHDDAMVTTLGQCFGPRTTCPAMYGNGVSFLDIISTTRNDGIRTCARTRRPFFRQNKREGLFAIRMYRDVESIREFKQTSLVFLNVHIFYFFFFTFKSLMFSSATGLRLLLDN